MIIAADMMIAIPLALVAISIMAGSIVTSQSYAVSMAQHNYDTIQDYSISQQAVLELEAATNYTQAYTMLHNLSTYYGIQIGLLVLNASVSCHGSLCRIVEVQGDSYLMMIE